MDSLKKRFPRYSKLLSLYPAGYKREYGEQMLQTLADMLDDEQRRPAAVWVQLAVDFPFSVIKQQASYTGATMTHDMPRFAKRNAAFGAALLLPFILALLANGLDTAINSRTLYNSWLWRVPVLNIWALWLPLTGALFVLASFIALLRQRGKASRTSWFRQIFDVRHNWPLLIVTLASVFIVGLVLFHDSVHCVTGNPVRELHNPSQTLQCIEQR